jgi:recombination DNA repair RAD52 pathway protein
MSAIYQNLSEPFPNEMQRTLNKGGASLTYIPVSEVINRMNKVIGVENWSFTVTSWQQLGTSIVAHVSVIATINGVAVTRDGVGGQKIKLNKQGEPVDIGDEVKGAVSDALKKAVQTLGVGLYLARSEDAIEIEQVMEAEAPQPINEEAANAWDNFIGISKTFTKEQKTKLRETWNEFSNSSPVPTRETVSVKDAMFLHESAVAIAFNAEVA